MKWWVILVSLIVFLSFSSLINSSLKGPETVVVAKKVYMRVNQYREQNGLRPLKVQKELSQIAYTHSRNMASGKVAFSHEGFQERIQQVKAYAKIDYRVAENLYATYNTSSITQDALRDWLNSAGHKKNIHGNFLFTGVGVARSESGEYFITQLFVGRR